MFAGESVHAIQTVLLLLLVFVAAFAVVARRLRVPYPIVLVIAGLVVSFVPHFPRIPLNPQLVFLIFLPPLLYSSAWELSWRDFRYNVVSICMLAVGLVAFTVWGVAEFSGRFITALDWKSGFVLGAVVATTDAIAATSIARTLGLPRSIVDVLQGESLMNDATGLLALEFGLRMLTQGESPTVWTGVLRLAYLTGAGVLIGLAIGYVVSRFSVFNDDGPVEIVVSLVVPYVAYLAGDAVHASGVFAVVACGLYMSRQSATIFSPAVRMQLIGVWEGLTFMLNGIVFALIGLQLPLVLAAIRGTYGWGTLLSYGLVFSAVLIVLRLVWTYPGAWLAYFIQAKLLKHTDYAPPEAKQVFVVGWTGMRGVLALAAALSLPEILEDGRLFATRNLIIFLAFSVILVTLVLQGLTLPLLIRWLGLARPSGMEDEEREARRVVLESAIAYLEQGRLREEPFEHVYDDLLHRYRHRLAAVGGGTQENEYDGLDAETYARMRTIAAGAVRVERHSMISLRNEGRISDDTMRTMEHELDLLEMRYQAIAE